MVGQKVYFTPDHGMHGHGGGGQVKLVSVEGDECTIEITGLFPPNTEYDYGCKVFYGPEHSTIQTNVLRKHIYDLDFLTDW